MLRSILGLGLKNTLNVGRYFSHTYPTMEEKAYYLLFYEDLVDGYVEKREPFREEHIKLVKELTQNEKLVLAGAFEPATGAALAFHCEKQDILDHVARDPYVQNGLVGQWRIEKWTVVVGSKYEPEEEL